MDSALNDLAALNYALAKDTPAKAFFFAQAGHPAVYRALRMDPAEWGAFYASLPFRLDKTEEGARILWAWPMPRVLGPVDDNWLGIETVLAWYPHLNRVEVLGDAGAHHIGAHDPMQAECHIYSDPFAFFRANVEDRAQWYMRRAVMTDWQAFEEPAFHPGYLITGDAEKVRWPVSAMPSDIVCHGIDENRLNRAILKQARIPRARSSQQFQMKAA